MINQEEIKKLLNYDKETGIFTWKEKRNWRANKGDIAGSINHSGYINIKINGKLFKAHRLAWIYVYGYWPIVDIDHIDHIKTNNKISNLRDVSTSINMQNQNCASSISTTGLLGVCFHKATNKYQASITINKKRIHLGLFLSAEEAYSQYLIAKRKYHEGCTI